MKVNHCAQCGGVTLIDYYRTPKAELMEARQGLLPPLVFLLCPGHPAEKHDGQLDSYDRTEYPQASFHAFAKMEQNENGSHLYIYGGYGDGDACDISLDAKQALSLLAWLQQEESALKQLAQEGGGSRE